MLDYDERLPAEPGRILYDPNLRRRAAVEDDVEPEILFEPLCRLEFVGREGNFTDT